MGRVVPPCMCVAHRGWQGEGLGGIFKGGALVGAIIYPRCEWMHAVRVADRKTKPPLAW